MSLDVTLYRSFHASYDGGKTWEEMREAVYSDNITHNLNVMADAAGIYEALWRPHRLREGYNIPEGDHDAEYDFEDRCEIKAKELIDKLEKGLAELKAKPEHYKKFDSPNGWGLYVNFVPFVEEYLNACKEYPEAEVSVWR